MQIWSRTGDSIWEITWEKAAIERRRGEAQNKATVEVKHQILEHVNSLHWSSINYTKYSFCIHNAEHVQVQQEHVLLNLRKKAMQSENKQNSAKNIFKLTLASQNHQSRLPVGNLEKTSLLNAKHSFWMVFELPTQSPEPAPAEAGFGWKTAPLRRSTGRRPPNARNTTQALRAKASFFSACITASAKRSLNVIHIESLHIIFLVDWHLSDDFLIFWPANGNTGIFILVWVHLNIK